MKTLGLYKKVAFDTIDELKEFVGNYFEALYYDGDYGEYQPIVDDDKGNLYIGEGCLREVTERDLDDIFGYVREKRR